MPELPKPAEGLEEAMNCLAGEGSRGLGIWLGFWGSRDELCCRLWV